MAKQVNNSSEVAVEEAINKTELFFEKNGKKVIAAILAIVIILALGYTYKRLVIDAKADKAAALIAEAQYRFEGETADYALALNGDQNGAGFLEIAEQYGSTPAGNLAKHYAGICFLKTGDKENATKWLAKFKPVKGLAGQIINAQNLGLQGDIAVDEGNFEKAATLFGKAVKASDNDYTAPLYLKKQGMAFAAAGKTDDAAKCFTTIKEQYPASAEARDADKMLGGIEK